MKQAKGIGKNKAALLSMVLLLALLGCSKVSKENYEKVQIGMTYDQVVEILGKPDNCEDAVLKTRSCRWGSDEEGIRIKFVAENVAWRSSKGL